MKAPLGAGLLFLLFSFVTPPVTSLTVTFDDNYPPYSFRDAQGRGQGILFDEWNLWASKTGEPVTLVPLPWSQALATMAEGKADVLDTVFLTEARSRVYDFTAPYASIETAVFVKEGLVGIREPADLKGFLVGVKAGDAGADAVRAAGVGGVKEYPSYVALVDAAIRGDVALFCMDVPPAQHLLFAKGVGSQFRQAFVLAEDAFRRAVAKGRTDLLARVNAGFAKITPAEREAIMGRWRGSALSDPLATQAVAVTVVGSLAVIFLLMVAVVLLRAQVKRRTGELVGTEERLKLSEDRARAVVEALPDLLFILEADGVIVECHPPPDNELYQNPGRFVGQRLSLALSPEVASEVLAKMGALAAGGGVAVIEKSLEIDGRLRTFDARIVRMGDGRFLAIVRDVSASRRAWQDDLHRNKLESLGVLAGGLAHDFNNSLAVIQGFVSLARVQVSSPEKALASLDKAVQATRRAAGLTSQLRVLAHGSEVKRTVVSVRELAEEAASFALVGTPCLLAIEAGTGPWNVEADPDQLSQVFHNLVLNAVQAMPGGGKVTLVFERRPEDKISVSVVDQGAGIPSQHRDRLFDPYFTTKPKGSGLGLSVVHAVVDRHGGSLNVESRDGLGASFTVTLPATAKVPESDAAVAPQGAPGLQGLRVLVMEDEADLRELMVLVLGSLGLAAQACRNGRDAVAAFDEALLRGEPFSLVVSDLLVPGGMGGREMISVLRSRQAQFRALAVTGFSVDRSLEDFHNQGFDVIIGKPFTVEEFKNRVVELLQSPWKTAPSS